MKRKRSLSILIMIGIAILQVIATQVVTFLASFVIPGMENSPQTQPVLLVAILDLTYTIGIFATGWLAIRAHWLKSESWFVRRLIGTIVGVSVPLLMALFFSHPVGPDNPLLFPISVFTGIAGFFLAGLGKSLGNLER